jgi:hypothetical protein
MKVKEIIYSPQAVPAGRMADSRSEKVETEGEFKK